MEFNISNCSINASQIGNHNKMKNYEPITNEEWERLESILERKIETLDKKSIYYFLAKEANDYTLKKDHEGLKVLLKKYATEFASGIFCNIASTGIWTILSKLGI